MCVQRDAGSVYSSVGRCVCYGGPDRQRESRISRDGRVLGREKRKTRMEEEKRGRRHGRHESIGVFLRARMCKM